MGVYIRVDEPLPAGIYHNSDLGLISLSSDGSNWITIADKNLGATQVYNDGDTLSEANAGKFYQWGNNYGFPWTGSVTTSSTKVDASSYGPLNYYNSSTFITVNTTPYDWSSVTNNDLRGGETGTVEAMQGPCNNGFHIGTNIERQNIIDIGIAISARTANTPNDFITYMKIPRAYYRDTTVVDGSSTGRYFTSIYNGEWSAYILQIFPTTLSVSSMAKACGVSIRPIKNIAVQPDETRTVLYQPS